MCESYCQVVLIPVHGHVANDRGAHTARTHKDRSLRIGYVRAASSVGYLYYPGSMLFLSPSDRGTEQAVMLALPPIRASSFDKQVGTSSFMVGVPFIPRTGMPA